MRWWWLVLALLVPLPLFAQDEDEEDDGIQIGDDEGGEVLLDPRELFDEGKALFVRGEFTRARERFEKALKRYEPEDRKGRGGAITWSYIGLCRLAEGRPAEALKAQQASLKGFRELYGARQHPDVAAALTNVAQCLRRLERFKEALALYEESLAMHRRVARGPNASTALCLRNLAQLHEHLGDFDRAQRTLRRASAIAEKLHGVDHWKTGDAQRAVSDLELRAKLSSEQRERLRSANALDDQALRLRQAGRAQEGLSVATRAAEIRRTILGATHALYAVSLNNLGELHQSIGEYVQTERLLRAALDIERKVLGTTHPTYAATLHNLAAAHLAKGEYANAELVQREALAITKACVGVEHVLYATSLNNLGALYGSMGEHVKAESFHRRALEIRKRVLGGAARDYASSLCNLAGTYRSMGEYAKAESLHRQALEVRKKALGEAHPDYATSLHGLAVLYHSMGEYTKAEPLYREALRVRARSLGEAHPDYATNLGQLGILYGFMGAYARAEPLLREALEIRQRVLGEAHPNYAVSLVNLASLYKYMGEHAKAKPLLHDALAIQQGLLDTSAAVLSERQQFQMARLYRGVLDSYLSRSAVAGGRAAEALTHVLAWKGAIFARQARARLMTGDSVAAGLFEEFDGVSRRLATLSRWTPGPKQAEARLRQIEQLMNLREELEREFSIRSDAFRRARTAKRLAPSDVQRALPAGVVLVDFLEYGRTVGEWAEEPERHLVAFVVPASGEIRRVGLGPEAPIAKLIDKWRQGLAGASSAGAGTKLRALVWEPIEKHLKGAKTVLVSPDGALTRLPFAALPGKKPGTYLVEEVAVAVVPVPQLLPEILARERTEGDSLLLIGDVDYGAARSVVVTVGRSAAREPGGARTSFAPLASTRGEILAIRDSFEQRYEDGAVKVLRSDKATEAAFREYAGQHRWLHVATHGFFAPAGVKSAQKGEVGYHPGLLSGLALAGANRKPDPDHDDGILTALEVASLNLSGVEVAVLSACETGLGEVAGGEGVLGLQRAFQVAGARTTVTSLWRVPDDATRLLMERFYENVWSKKRGKLEALREAQLWMLEEGRARGMKVEGKKDARVPPYYWAAFVLSGDWR